MKKTKSARPLLIKRQTLMCLSADSLARVKGAFSPIFDTDDVKCDPTLK
jgi:hypothetical protein